MMQQNDQEVKDFILELQNQATKCSFEEQFEIQLLDRLIAWNRITSLEEEIIRKLKMSVRDTEIACLIYKAVNEFHFQSVKNFNTLLGRYDELHTQSRSSWRLFNNGPHSRGNLTV
ncbi:unnamed protein product [Schistosoma mattheei]|uniref:Uncharacterized protein n=1 Tax=Schistosoma mattheei TaxID=31246 RepID=A0A183Q085_9TREM|nr:unnamed protein product [Schistosoma mattheei]